MNPNTETEQQCWQVVEVTGVGIGELWFDVVEDGLTRRDALGRTTDERHIVVPMPYDPDDEESLQIIKDDYVVDDYSRGVVPR